MTGENTNTTSTEQVLSTNGFRTMAAWLADKIKELWASEQQSLKDQLYPVVGMMYLFHDVNVQAISQYGINDKTYVFGDSSTEDISMDRPKNALYYLDPQGESTINGVQVSFVTTEDGYYIETQPNDQGKEFQAEYHDYITYLG